MRLKILKSLIYLTVASLLIGPLGIIPPLIPTVNIYITDLLVSFVCLFLLINLANLHSFFGGNRLVFPFVIFITIGFVSNILSPISISIYERIISFLYLARYVSYFGFYIAVSYLIKLKEIRKQKILNLLVWILFGLAIFGWVQYFLYPDLRNLSYLGWDPHFKRIFATYFDPNFLGIIFVLGLMILFFGGKENIFFWIVKILFVFITLMFTYSRSSFLALIAPVVYFSFVKKKLWLVAGVSCIMILTALLLPRPFGEGVKLERTFSISNRLNNWTQGFRIFVKHPILGVGFNNIRYARREYKIEDSLMTSHSGAGFDNSFLFVGVTTGIIGLVSFIFLLFRCYTWSNLLGKAILVSIVVHSLFLNSLFFPWVMLWMWVILAIMG